MDLHNTCPSNSASPSSEELQDKNYDLVYDAQSGLLRQRCTEPIQFDCQFILRELLHRFLRYPGVSFSKEEIVNFLWNENYDPRVHDNRVYVTIRRLRRKIELSGSGHRFIIRTKHGYSFNGQILALVR